MKCPRCGDDDCDSPVCTCGYEPKPKKAKIMPTTSSSDMEKAREFYDRVIDTDALLSKLQEKKGDGG